MKVLQSLLFLCLLPISSYGEIKKTEKSLFSTSDGEVVDLEQILEKPLLLQVVKEVPVFSDHTGAHRLGALPAGQNVRLEAITDKAYKVLGKGKRHGIAGWVTPTAFHSTNPHFIEDLKKLHARQIQVRQFIAAKKAAIGMTLHELSLAKGKPTKSSDRKTAEGSSGFWEFIEYEEKKIYDTRIDRNTGMVYRVLSHIEQIERSKTRVEFHNDLVTAIEENSDEGEGNVRIVVPPLILAW